MKHGHLGRASFPPPSYSSSRHCMSFPPHSSCFMSHCTFSPLHTQFCPRTSVFCPSSSQGSSLLPFSMTQLLICLCSAVWTFPTHPLPPFCRIWGDGGPPLTLRDPCSVPHHTTTVPFISLAPVVVFQICMQMQKYWLL